LSTQVPTGSAELEAWVRFLRGHATVLRRLNGELVSTHGLTVNDLEVLLQLSQAPDGLLRRVDLAERVLLTPSGITRLLEGLERAGLVERARCPEDRRVVYAKLTEAGEERLRVAGATHRAGVRTLFAERYSAEELAALSALLTRLPGADVGDDGACGE
jgi:DNA-binding MarR family transcriptional regulator